jgi:hypothetical protein
MNYEKIHFEREIIDVVFLHLKMTFLDQTHLSYIPPMLMLKIYRPRWTQCDDNTLDPLGLDMVR